MGEPKNFAAGAKNPGFFICWKEYWNFKILILCLTQHKTNGLMKKTIQLTPVIPDKYVERRDYVIREITNNMTTIWGDDSEVIPGVHQLLSELQSADPAPEFVNGLYGFMIYCGVHKVDGSAAMSTIVHDLSEFARHRNENWFCPRTTRYQKYLSGASGVEVNN